MFIEHSGLSRYCFEIATSILKRAHEFESLIFLSNKRSIYQNNVKYQTLSKLIKQKNNTKLHVVEHLPFKLSGYLLLHRTINKFSDHAYLYPHYDSPLFIKNKTFFVVHDLFVLLLGDYVTRFRVVKKLVFYLHLLHSLLFYNCLTISKSTKRDIKHHYDFMKRKKISVIYSGISNISLSTEIEEINYDYLFYIGDFRPHKNLKRMIDIFTILQDQYKYSGKFIIAGNNETFDFDVTNYVKNNADIIIMGNISDQSLKTYLFNMQALFFFSKYEGFGLPILEAAHYNKKIITTNISAIPEVAPKNSLLLELEDSDLKCAEHIHHYLKKSVHLNNSEHLKKFTWERAAAEMLKEISS